MGSGGPCGRPHRTGAGDRRALAVVVADAARDRALTRLRAVAVDGTRLRVQVARARNRRTIGVDYARCVRERALSTERRALRIGEARRAGHGALSGLRRTLGVDRADVADDGAMTFVRTLPVVEARVA